LIDTLPQFPAPRDQRDVAGRHYLTKAEIALYFATHKMGRPRGWDVPHPIGRYWRAAMVVFFSYGVDTGTVWRSTPAHEPILWRHVIWDRKSPHREAKERSPWGWLFYRRAKKEILGHLVGGITYRHYAHRAPLAFRAIMTLPQPSAFSAILRGGDSECPCCRRRFADAG
jgi:hypothetical protein